jgi:hypothetical protein
MNAIMNSIPSVVANCISAGTYTECMYQLLTFGIPREAIPIMDNGSVDLSHHHKMLDSLKYMEDKGKPKEEIEVSTRTSSIQSTSSDSGSFDNAIAPAAEQNQEEYSILIASPMDVLMGKGRRPKSSRGALRMHYLLAENMDAYESTNHKLEKMIIAEKILMEMKVLGCRFLREAAHGACYVEIDDATARAKIALGFRNMRRKKTEKNSAGSTQNDSDLSRAKKKRNRPE